MTGRQAPPPQSVRPSGLAATGSRSLIGVTDRSPRASEQSKAERTRRRILDSAAHQLARHGYGGTSLRSVAAGADLQMPSLYFHFASKDELVAAAMADGIDSTVDRIRRALDALPPGTAATERLRVAIEEHVDALQVSHDHAVAVIKMSATLPEALRREHVQHERDYVSLWADLLASAQDGGHNEPRAVVMTLARFVVGGLNGFLDTSLTAAETAAIASAVLATVTAPPGH